MNHYQEITRYLDNAREIWLTIHCIWLAITTARLP